MKQVIGARKVADQTLIEVQARMFGEYLAVHPYPFGDPRWSHSWIVTHVLTGLAVSPYLTKTGATTLAKELQKLGDFWGFVNPKNADMDTLVGAGRLALKAKRAKPKNLSWRR